MRRFSRYVYAIAVQVYRLNAADAEEVFQETFARTYEHLGRLRDDEAIKPWIAQTTRRLSVDRLRAGAREGPVPEEPDQGHIDEAIGRLDEALVVRSVLATLPMECQEILDRFFARDESYKTIGAALGLPAGTVASRISRCLAKLRDGLGDDVELHMHHGPASGAAEDHVPSLIAMLPPAPPDWAEKASARR